MRGESVNLCIKLEEFRGQRSSLRRGLQELRATLEDRDSSLEDMRVMLEHCNDEVAAMEERVTQQDLAEARSATSRAMEAESLKERQVAALQEEQIEAIWRQLNSSEATARKAHSRFQVQMEVQRPTLRA